MSYYGRRNTHSSLRTYKIKKYVITKMSYNEIPNNLVDSVVLPNKPLSNLEKFLLLKRYHCINLEGYL